MRVTVRKQNVIESHNEEPKPTYHADCEECGKEIAFTKDDITHGAYGCVMVNCICQSV